MKVNKKIYVVINPEGRLSEVFMSKNNAGGFAKKQNKYKKGFTAQPAKITYDIN